MRERFDRRVLPGHLAGHVADERGADGHHHREALHHLDQQGGPEDHQRDGDREADDHEGPVPPGGGSERAASAITTALSPDRMMFTPMILSSAVQKTGSRKSMEDASDRARMGLIILSANGRERRSEWP